MLVRLFITGLIISVTAACSSNAPAPEALDVPTAKPVTQVNAPQAKPATVETAAKKIETAAPAAGKKAEEEPAPIKQLAKVHKKESAKVRGLPTTLSARECVSWSGQIERDRDNANAQAWGNITQQVAERASLMDDKFKKLFPKKRRIETFKKAAYGEARKFTETLRPKQISTEKDKQGKIRLCADVEIIQNQLYTIRDLLINQEDSLEEGDVYKLQLSFDGKASDD